MEIIVLGLVEYWLVYKTNWFGNSIANGSAVDFVFVCFCDALCVYVTQVLKAT